MKGANYYRRRGGRRKHRRKPLPSRTILTLNHKKTV